MFNFLFHFLIPKSTATKIIIKPKGPYFINGLSKKYSTKFPKQLESYLKPEEFTLIIDEINDILQTYWSCTPALLFGYLFCLFTFGLSFLIPYVCINEAVKFIEDYFAKINWDILKRRGVQIGLRRYWVISWIEVNVMDNLESVEHELIIDKV